MEDKRVIDMVKLTNQKIEYLNSHLQKHGINEFYKVPLNSLQKEHVTRMVNDLDYLVAQTDVDVPKIEEPYLTVRDRLLEMKEALSPPQSDQRPKDNA